MPARFLSASIRSRWHPCRDIENPPFDGGFSMMKNRPRLLHAVTWSLQHYPVVALLGPRQCGKTTLARMVVPHSRAK
jgi:polynucleotide 5'-kinase involved in rRNA processing